MFRSPNDLNEHELYEWECLVANVKAHVVYPALVAFLKAQRENAVGGSIDSVTNDVWGTENRASFGKCSIMAREMIAKDLRCTTLPILRIAMSDVDPSLLSLIATSSLTSVTPKQTNPVPPTFSRRCDEFNEIDNHIEDFLER